MNRFFVDKVEAEDKYIILNDPDQLHHLRDVLRIKPLERVAIFDNSGNEYITKVIEIGPLLAKLEIKEKKLHQDPKVLVTVACAIPKKVKMDDIIDKLTQLGVECIIPLETERVIVKLDKQKKAQRCLRWEKIALSAVKQSQGNRVTIIKPISSLKDVLIIANEFDLKLILTLEGNRQSLKEVFSRESKKNKKVMVLIGPEGDFTPQEVALAEKAGFLAVSLGERVLRVDTAAIAAVSFIKLNEEY
ncbi:MAG: RsmE family RNA methyltransferase [Candidatus Omnitrophica bacterium]|nr:RsmE family RNA methyltransferase [Candidatus Omnitrophota bacterium]